MPTFARLPAGTFAARTVPAAPHSQHDLGRTGHMPRNKRAHAFTAASRPGSRRVDTLLQELIAPAGPEVLLETILKLGARHPSEVYTFVVDALRSGQAAEAAKRIREDYHTGQYL